MKTKNILLVFSVFTISLWSLSYSFADDVSSNTGVLDEETATWVIEESSTWVVEEESNTWATIRYRMEELKEKMEEVKYILKKKQRWEELTEEEQDKLAEMIEIKKNQIWNVQWKKIWHIRKAIVEKRFSNTGALNEESNTWATIRYGMEELKEKMEEVKYILEKRQKWEELTEEEQAKLDEIMEMKKNSIWNIQWKKIGNVRQVLTDKEKERLKNMYVKERKDVKKDDMKELREKMDEIKDILKKKQRWEKLTEDEKMKLEKMMEMKKNRIWNVQWKKLGNVKKALDNEDEEVEEIDEDEFEEDLENILNDLSDDGEDENEED